MAGGLVPFQVGTATGVGHVVAAAVATAVAVGAEVAAAVVVATPLGGVTGCGEGIVGTRWTDRVKLVRRLR